MDSAAVPCFVPEELIVEKAVEHTDLAQRILTRFADVPIARVEMPSKSGCSPTRSRSP
jgi:hypothetical protein